MKATSNENGFSVSDFALLENMAAGDGEIVDGVDELWAKASRLIVELGGRLADEPGFAAAIWPDRADDERLPFIWARLKRPENAAFATHIGLFLSPRLCNLGIDLEKDLIDAGDAAERLEQVMSFYGGPVRARIEALSRPDLMVWTDSVNKVPARSFSGVSLKAFMASNKDLGHPWPRIGYLFDARQVCGFGDGWVDAMAERAVELVPIYDAMIRAYGRR